MAAIDTKTFNKTSAEAVVTSFLALTFSEQQYVISRLTLESPRVFQGNNSLPDGASSIKPPFYG